eukprot:TRINITY_DN11427_c0_g2_i2.p1 TRINITY_DN11427_c0_g2~~TRINITY_DN11427_c0_g2_i2.p1  ORF type:complete len:410 (-),score=56.43 TRINITY_DN11427_c0_g2_i2:365-1594(-)
MTSTPISRRDAAASENEMISVGQTKRLNVLDKSSEGWKENFLREFTMKIISQLSEPSFCASAQMIDSLRMAVRWGIFYTINAASALEGSLRGNRLSVAQLEEALTKHRICRKSVERESWKQIFSKPEPKEYERVELSSSVGLSSTGKSKRSGARSKPKMGFGFYNGVLNYTPTTLSEIETYENNLYDFFLSQGFIFSNTEGSSFQIQMNPSKSTALVFRFDTNLNLVGVTEKPFYLVHATLLNGMVGETHTYVPTLGFLRNHDLRFLFSVIKSVEPNSDYIRSVYPNQEIPPFSLFWDKNKSSCPVVKLTNGFSKEVRDKISFFQYRVKKYTFYDPTTALTAHFEMGYYFLGKDFQLKSPYLSVSFLPSCEPLKRYLKTFSNLSEVDSYITRIVQKILDISDTFSKLQS